MGRISVDFNTMMQDTLSDPPRVVINERYLDTPIRSGMQVTIFDEEMEVKAVLEFDSEHDAWWAQPEWSTRRDLPYP